MKSRLPATAPVGTPLWCTDTKELYIGTGSGVQKIESNGSSSDEIISAVVSAGYNASLKGKSTASDNSADTSAHKEIRALKVRLFVSAGFLFFLMYISMGHVMFNLPLPDFFTGNFLAIGLCIVLFLWPL